MRFNIFDRRMKTKTLEISEQAEKQRHLQRIIEFSRELAKPSNVIYISTYKRKERKMKCKN